MKTVSNLTPGQVSVLAEVDRCITAKERRLILWWGGVRAGKSTGAGKALIKHSYPRNAAEYVIGAYTQRQVWAIFGPIIKTECAEYGITYKAIRGGTDPRMEIGDNVIYVYGGNEAGKDRNVQGLTLDGLVLDEIPLLNREFIFQNEARVSKEGALRIYTANKPSPYHWTTLHYFNRATRGEINAFLIDSDTKDNEHIGQDYIDERVSEYDELHRDRFINNQFVLDKPPLYSLVYDDSPDYEQPDLSVIYCDGSDFVCLHAKKTSYGYCLVSSPYHSLTDSLDDLGLGNTVLVNSERALLAKVIRDQGRTVKGYDGTYNAKKVEFTQSAFNSGVLKVSPTLETLMQAVDEYSTGGIYKFPHIRAMEILGEYIIRRG